MKRSRQGGAPGSPVSPAPGSPAPAPCLGAEKGDGMAEVVYSPTAFLFPTEQRAHPRRYYVRQVIGGAIKQLTRAGRTGL